MIREISWRLREIGNDGRICDLIDSQVASSRTGAEQISSDEARAALDAAFAAIEERLAEFAATRGPRRRQRSQVASPASPAEAGSRCSDRGDDRPDRPP